MTEFPYLCPLCQSEVVTGGTWMGNCSGCERSINYCECEPVKPKEMSPEEWRERQVRLAIYATGMFTWDEGCLTDAGLKLKDQILKIFGDI